MSDVSSGEVCPLVIRTSERAIELAVPTDVPLIELLPTLVRYAGAGKQEDLAERGVEHGGWVLQRLGADALDEERTVTELGVRDGETLYLRPRRDQLPPVHFDDLVDGVATAMKGRSDAWRPELTHHLLLGLTALVLTAVLLLLAFGSDALPVPLLSSGVSVLLLLGGASASRAVGDTAAGALLGAMAVPFMTLAGALIPSGPPGHALLGARWLAGATAGAGAAALAVAVVAAMVPVFLALIVICVLGAVGGAVMLFAGVGISEAAGVMALLAVLLGAFAPTLAFWIAGFRLPPLPTNPEQLQEEIDPYPSRALLSRATLAGHYLTALFAAAGVACVGSLTLLATRPDWSSCTLGLVVSGLALLHSRAVSGGWQRLAVVVPGAYGLVLFSLGGAWNAEITREAVMLTVFLLAAAGLVIGAWRIPGRRLAPYWGRLTDIMHTLLAIAVIPLVVIDLGILHALRALGG